MSGNSGIDEKHALLEDDNQDEAELSAQWARVRHRLQAEVGDVEYRTWLRQMSFGGVDGDEVTIRLPSRFLRDWVRSHHGDRLSALWQIENARIRRVDIRVDSPGASTTGLAESVSISLSPANGDRPMARSDERAEPRPEAAAVLDPRFTFDSFVVGKPNEFAYACARRVAASPAAQGFNPLFLYGGVGLGKTHLMHAIAWDLLRPAGGRSREFSVAYMSSEKFMHKFITAIRSNSTMEFKEQLRSVDVLMIDDL
ncbi:MAG TPA: DnaA/Hda family protein, partial [Acetobacteraceae bacterium]|nr:DnaA/Hda family protein [Acetobacteraceae bacterium]